MRELDERLGLAGIIAAHLHDARHGRNTQFRLPDLLRQSVYSRLAGYEDLNDAQRLSTDPTFRLIGSPTRLDRRAALTSTLHWFETELLTRDDNLDGLMAVRNRAGHPYGASGRAGGAQRGVRGHAAFNSRSLPPCGFSRTVRRPLRAHVPAPDTPKPMLSCLS